MSIFIYLCAHLRVAKCTPTFYIDFLLLFLNLYNLFLIVNSFSVMMTRKERAGIYTRCARLPFKNSNSFMLETVILLIRNTSVCAA